MPYFYNEDENIVISFNGGKILVFSPVMDGEAPAVREKKVKKVKTKKVSGLEQKRNPMAGKSVKRLMPEVVAQIKEMLGEGVPVTEIADQVGVSQASIHYYKTAMAKKAREKAENDE